MEQNSELDGECEASCVVIFGGTGFIGAHLAKTFLGDPQYDAIYLLDLRSLEDHGFHYRSRMLEGEDKIRFVKADVRDSLSWFRPAERVALAVNLAAVHREPGHKPNEYFETNLFGAQNVCDWAEALGCENLIFASSIAPYGSEGGVKDESSLPCPTTPYGASKLVAEKIHQLWLARGPLERRLLILRPGVVFGPSEGGNVSRLIKAVTKGYFVYMGNHETRKAGVYVKELCASLIWMMRYQKIQKENLILYNISMKSPPSIKEYVDTITKIHGKNKIKINIPFFLIYFISKCLEVFCNIFRFENTFSPMRVRKLIYSNDVEPQKLLAVGYKFRWEIQAALRDWRAECPEEWE